jgi:hypothetical protein
MISFVVTLMMGSFQRDMILIKNPLNGGCFERSVNLQAGHCGTVVVSTNQLKPIVTARCIERSNGWIQIQVYCE